MTTPREALGQGRALLLDFDGPVAYLMPAPRNAEVAERTRAAAGTPLPDDLIATSDHIAILKHLVTHNPTAAAPAHEAATQAEIECAAHCDPAPWFLDLSNHLRTTRAPVAIVTNNSPECVARFLERWGLGGFAPVVGRRSDRLAQMKPAPDYLTEALALLSAEAGRARFVGDSLSDVQAGKAAGVPVVGFAKNASRAEALASAGAVSVIRADAPWESPPAPSR